MTTEYEQALDEQLKIIKEILLQKHHDYGADNLKRHGLKGILVRLDDKTARIDNLLKIKDGSAPNKVGETIEDTFYDIAGYAIQAILLSQNRLGGETKHSRLNGPTGLNGGDETSANISGIIPIIHKDKKNEEDYGKYHI
jgi:hypothetical protein